MRQTPGPPSDIFSEQDYNYCIIWFFTVLGIFADRVNFFGLGGEVELSTRGDRVTYLTMSVSHMRQVRGIYQEIRVGCARQNVQTPWMPSYLFLSSTDDDRSIDLWFDVSVRAGMRLVFLPRRVMHDLRAANHDAAWYDEHARNQFPAYVVRMRERWERMSAEWREQALRRYIQRHLYDLMLGLRLDD